MGSTRIFSLLNIIFHSNIFSQSKRWEQEWKCSTCNFVAFGRNPIQPDQVMSHVALSARIQSAKAASKCASNRAHLRYNDVSEKNYMITPPLSLPPSLSLYSFLPSFLFSFFFPFPPLHLLFSSPCFRINNPEQGLASFFDRRNSKATLLSAFHAPAKRSVSTLFSILFRVL